MVASGHTEEHKHKHAHSPSGNIRMYPYFVKDLANVTTNTDFGLRNMWSQTPTYHQFYVLKTFLVPRKP